GPSLDDAEAEAAIRARDVAARHRVSEPACLEERIAELLVADGVVARCAGRMEFGARALGNRSIHANPADHRVVGLINRMIKNRDFWMPFEPSVLREREADYLVNPKGLASPYMMLALPTNPKRCAPRVGLRPPTVRAGLTDPATNDRRDRDRALLHAGHRARGAHPREEGLARGADARGPRAHRAPEPDAQRRLHAHRRAGTRGGARGRRRRDAGPRPRPAPRHPVHHQGPRLYEGRPDDVRVVH